MSNARTQIAQDEAPATVGAKPLYVSRKLLNGADVRAWALAQGFKEPLLADDMHVTVAYSKAACDWSGMGRAQDAVSIGPQMRDRSVGKLGDGATVLHFFSPNLSERWAQMCAAGASWDYDAYQPHVTISYESPDFDVSGIEPYTGPLEFGPEVFADIDPPAQDIGLALDRETVRSFSPDGHMHVSRTNISKATVNPYFGREIPGAESLGLDPDRIYRLLRDPDELRRAAPTFRNLPLLSEHVPVSADNHPADLVIGSTGSDVEFAPPYLTSSLSIWPAYAVELIEADEQKELSCAYRYRADMTPGFYEGAAYDGVMRDIVGNHVALVKQGRAGPDVVVGDSQPNFQQEIIMSKGLSARAAFVSGGVIGLLSPRLAADAQIDLSSAFVGITTKNFGEKKAGLVADITKALDGKLAKDAKLDDLSAFLDRMGAVKIAEDDAPEKKPDGAEDEDDEDDKDKKAEDGDDDDDDKKKKAEDEDDDDKKDKVDKKAMDAAIKSAVAAERKNSTDLRNAEKHVRDWVGELNGAFDSGEAVYRESLRLLGVKDHDTIHASALRTILELQPKPGARKQAPASAHAMDAAGAKTLNDMFPTISRIGHI